ncbi:MAG: gfo/Idh/MocA family oxidoreductase, partial [Armatimonadota bacterium]
TAGGHGTSEYFMCNDFVRCITDDTAPAIDVYRGLDYSVPGICAHISAENGSEPVEVPDFR